MRNLVNVPYCDMTVKELEREKRLTRNRLENIQARIEEVMQGATQTEYVKMGERYGFWNVWIWYHPVCTHQRWNPIAQTENREDAIKAVEGLIANLQIFVEEARTYKHGENK